MYRRALAQLAVQSRRTTLRHSCPADAISETGYRYIQTQLTANAEIVDRLGRLASAYRA